MMIKRLGCAVALLCAVSLSSFGQAQFAGVYSGIIYVAVGSNPEASSGAILLAINNSGEITGQGLSGQVNSSGAITWDTPNALYLTTGTVANGVISSTGSTVKNNLTITTRLDAKNASAALPPTADPVLDSMVWVNPLPFGAVMQATMYLSNQFLAIGSGGLLATSSDGRNWVSQLTPSRRTMTGITFGKGTYVAIGEGETIMTSSNAQNWTLRTTTTGFKFDLGAVAFGNNVFLAVGPIGTSFYSADGVVWTARATTGASPYTDVKFLNGKFIIFGGSGGLTTFTSTDGATWTPGSTFSSLNPIRGIAYANSKYLASGVASDGYSRIIQSTDGATWTMNTNIVVTGIATNAIRFNYITAENGKFIAFDVSYFSYTSTDGINWQKGKPVLREPKSVAFGGGQYVAVGNTLSRSTDAVGWSDQVTRRQSPHINFVGGKYPNYIYVGQGGYFDRYGVNNTGAGVTNDLYSAVVSTSTFTDYTLGDGGLLSFGGFAYTVPGRELLRGSLSAGIANDPFNYLIYGNQGSIYRPRATTLFTNNTSINVITNFNKIASGTSADLLGAAGMLGANYLFGRSGTILRSTNIYYTNWVAMTSGTTADLYSGAKASFSNALAVIVGDQGTILTSLNGAAWTKRTSGTTEKLIHVSFQENNIFDTKPVYTTVSENGTVITSTDNGTNWNIVATNSFPGKLRSVFQPIPSSPSLSGAGDYGLVVGTDDRTNWTQTVIDGNFTQAVYGNGRWVVVGPFYYLLSVDGVRWEFHSFKHGAANLAYGGGRFVATTATGIITSADAINWVGAYSIANAGIPAYGGGRWLVPGQTNVIVSTDGVNWSAGPSSTAGQVQQLRYANGIFVGVNSGGNRPYSTNGTSWISNIVSANDQWRSVAYGKGLWVSVGSVGKLGTSTNGINWTPRNITGYDFSTVELVGDRFIATGTAGGTNFAMVSTNGTNWTAIGLPLPLAFNGAPAINGLLAVNGTFMAVGINGTILQSSYSVTGLPAISITPNTNISANAGAIISFKASVTGTAPFQYQWFHDGVPLVNKSRISGATSDTLTLTVNALEDSGDYSVEVVNAVGSRSSFPITLTVTAPPSFLTQPLSQTAVLGGRATFTALASGNGVAYQWFKNATSLSGQTNATLTLTSLQSSDAAAYTVVASNGNGGRTSAIANLSVTALPSYVLDASFAGSSIVFSNWAGYPSAIFAIRPIAGGQKLIGGTFKIIAGSKVFTGIARLNADATVDTTFNPPALQPSANVTYMPAVRAIQPLADGRFLLGGETTFYSPTRGVVLIQADGPADPVQPAIAIPGAGLGTHINAFAMQPDGKILITGSFVLNGLYHFGRLNTNLTVDANFGSSTIRLMSSEGYAIAQQPDQKIVIAGGNVIRVQTNGFNDLNFSTSTPGNLQNMVVMSDGRIAVGGNFVFAGHTNLALLESNGALIDSFQVNPNSSVIAMAKLADESIAVGGYLTQVNGVNTGQGALIHADGSVDNNFKISLDSGGPLNVIVQDTDGSILIGGAFKKVNGSPATNFARLSIQSAGVPLSIVQQPQSVSADAFDIVTLSVAAAGGSPLSFQWKKNGASISGATRSSLTLTNATTNDVANYTVTVTDPSGTQTSQIAALTVSGVSPAPPTGGFADWAVTANIPANSRGPADDPDGDRVPNIFEYYFGTNPTLSTSLATTAGAMVKSGGSNYPAITFVRSKTATGVTAEVQVSSKVTFSDSLGATQESVVDLGNGTERVTMRSTVNDRTQSVQFLRLRLSVTQ